MLWAGDRHASKKRNTLTNTITAGTIAYETYAHQHRLQDLHHPSQRHQTHHRQHHPTISVATGNLRHQRKRKPGQQVNQ